MNTKKSKLKILAVAAIASLVAGLGAMRIGAIRSSASAEPPMVATVDGQTISAKLYRMYLKNGIEALGLNDKTDEGRRQMELLKEGIISDLIDRQLIEGEVARRSLPVTDRALDEAYQNTIAQMGGQESYRSYLSEHALADDEFRRTVRQEVCGQLLRDELDKEVLVTGDEMSSFFNKEQNNLSMSDLFKEPERVRARHILIGARRSQIASEIQAIKTLSQAEIEQRVNTEIAKRRSRAAELLNRLRHGADFQRLAAEYSDDAGTKNRGGDLGLFTRNTHTAHFDEAAFALKPGRLSDIIETDYGFHIIQVMEHTPERARTLDEARPSIHQKLLAEKQTAHLKAWLENRRREADIRVDPFYPKGQLQTFAKS
ncbi:MAG TPA: peptidylprolyl isomerase [Blastocatellia bacterium]|nr:peptidylprolyl isomerase [Blastocatellia bacterium]